MTNEIINRSQFFVKSFDTPAKSTRQLSQQFWWYGYFGATTIVMPPEAELTFELMVEMTMIEWSRLWQRWWWDHLQCQVFIQSWARSSVYLNFRICALVSQSVLPTDEYIFYHFKRNSDCDSNYAIQSEHSKRRYPIRKTDEKFEKSPLGRPPVPPTLSLENVGQILPFFSWSSELGRKVELRIYVSVSDHWYIYFDIYFVKPLIFSKNYSF